MQDNISRLLEEIKSAQIATKAALEEYRLKYLSKKGKLNQLFEDFKKVSGEQKKELGRMLNTLKVAAQEKFESAQALFDSDKEEDNQVDITLPPPAIPLGSRHPLNIVMQDMLRVFEKLGFVIATGPEIEDDWHNFTALNFPENHPARDMQDTFFVENEYALRTHTTSVQIRVLENTAPPVRAVTPGRVYRNEAVSARANCFFHQVDGFYVDENVSFADLKQTLYYFVKELLGSDISIRFRPSYFPFTEPSAEMDITCILCNGKGCNVCKHTGWVEILGSGMIHPNVLMNCKIDPERYSGFAFGIGVERFAMLRYDVKDLRIFYENDTRFLSQFARG